MQSTDASIRHLATLVHAEEELTSKIDALVLLFQNDDVARGRRELRAWCAFAALCSAGLVVIGTLAASLVR